MARKNQIGYPAIFGDHKLAMWQHAGPTSYVQVSNAVPATGGDPVPATELLGQGGLKAADMLTALFTSDDGQYEAVAIPIKGNASSAAGYLPSSAWILRWVVSATGAEVAGAVNLSARSMMLIAIGK